MNHNEKEPASGKMAGPRNLNINSTLPRSTVKRKLILRELIAYLCDRFTLPEAGKGVQR
jgi:hypothetical protein